RRRPPLSLQYDEPVRVCEACWRAESSRDSSFLSSHNQRKVMKKRNRGLTSHSPRRLNPPSPSSAGSTPAGHYRLRRRRNVTDEDEEEIEIRDIEELIWILENRTGIPSSSSSRARSRYPSRRRRSRQTRAGKDAIPIKSFTTFLQRTILAPYEAVVG